MDWVLNIHICGLTKHGTSFRMSDKAPATGLGSVSQNLCNHSTNTTRIGPKRLMAQCDFMSLAVAERLNIRAEGSEFSWYIFHPLSFASCQTAERSIDQAQKSYLFHTNLSIFECWWNSDWSVCRKRWMLIYIVRHVLVLAVYRGWLPKQDNVSSSALRCGAHVNIQPSEWHLKLSDQSEY